MATRTCPHCGQQHALDAKFCPGTGRAIASTSGAMRWLGGLAALVILAGILVGGYWLWSAQRGKESSASIPASPLHEPVATSIPTTQVNPLPTTSPSISTRLLPDNLAVISLENVSAVKMLGYLGKGRVSEIAWSPRNDILAIASATGVYIYDARTLEEKHMLDARNAVFAMSFSVDGQRLAILRNSGSLRIWSPIDGTETNVLADDVSRVAFSPMGRTLATAHYDGVVKIWDLSIGNQPRRLAQFSEAVMGFAFSPDGKQLAMSSGSPDITLVDVESGQQTPITTSRSGPVSALAFSPDGKLLATVGDRSDKTIHVLNATNGQLLSALPERSAPTSLAFSSDSQHLVSTGVFLTVWDIATREIVVQTDRAQSRLALSPDGEALAWWDFRHGEVELIDFASRNRVGTLPGYQSLTQSVAISRDGHRLAAAYSNSVIMMWNLDTGQQLWATAAYTDTVSEISFSPDDQMLASASADKTVKLWNASSGELLAALTQEGESPLCVAISPDGKLLASGNAEGTVHLWRIDNRETVLVINGHGAAVSHVAFAPDGVVLASGSSDQTVKLWSISDGTNFRTFQGHEDAISEIAFSPNGRTVASASADNSIRLWDVTSTEVPIVLAGHTRSVYAIQWTPDGNSIASGSLDNTVRFWDIHTGREVYKLEGFDWGDGFVGLSLAFSPDGRWLASGSGTGTVRLWGITP